ncbi:integrase [Pseudomonas sp. BJa5]|uniref:integrase n=1 Tax=Pseudomonas sp. BJa5 TaxID=2936270 RepID=UPI0033393BF4
MSAWKATTNDLDSEFYSVVQGKTGKYLRIRLVINGEDTSLGTFLAGLLERRRIAGIRSSRLITNRSGLRMSWKMMNNRWNEARDEAMKQAIADSNPDLADDIRQFQFRDIRPKAASEIEDLSHASRLPGHSKEKITQEVYRRVGEVVSPTK